MFGFENYEIPKNLQKEIQDHIMRGAPVSEFMQCILCNDPAQRNARLEY